MDLQKGIKKLWFTLFWHVMTERLFSLPLTKVGIHFGHVRMYATPYPISWIIFILDLGPSYTDKLLEFRWVPLVADMFLHCYERDFMDSLNHDNQADVIEAFNSTSRYLDDLLNIDNPYFEGMVNQIYPHTVEQSQYLRYRSPLFRFTSFCFKRICFF